MGTWKIAVMSLDKPDHMYFLKNSGEIIYGSSDDYFVVSTEDSLF
jgi:hypothetical protein